MHMRLLRYVRCGVLFTSDFGMRWKRSTCWEHYLLTQTAKRSGVPVWFWYEGSGFLCVCFAVVLGLGACVLGLAVACLRLGLCGTLFVGCLTMSEKKTCCCACLVVALLFSCHCQLSNVRCVMWISTVLVSSCGLELSHPPTRPCVNSHHL